MTDEDLYTQFMVNFLSDRALLYLQWAHIFYNQVMFRLDKKRLQLWLDDILINPFQIECIWTIPEAELGNVNVLTRFGSIQCFSPHSDHEESYGSRTWLTRSFDSLDPFTLLLLTELIHRKEMKFDEIARPEFGRVRLRLNFQSHKLTLNPTLIQEARRQCFKHLLLMMLTLPFLLVNIPDKKLTLLNGRSILDLSLASCLAVIADIGQYVATWTDVFDPTEQWVFDFASALTLIHDRSERHVSQFLVQLTCPCQLCKILKNVFSKHYTVHLHEQKQQNVTNGNLILAYFYNMNLKRNLWYDAQEDAQEQEEFIRQRDENIRQCFYEFGHDTYSLKEYNRFMEKWNQLLLETKKRKREEFETPK